MRKIYRRLRGDGPLWRIGMAITGALALALALAVAVTVTGLHLLHFQGFKPEPELTPTTAYDLLKVAFAFAAGVGGVIALVTAYRRQRITELAEHREGSRLFNERFATAAGQLGDDKPAAVRLAGVYAMAGLADDWPAQRQTCVDVLCAYLRMPYEPDPGPDADPKAQQAFRALREIRHTVIRVITAHLQAGAWRAATTQDWRGLDLDFTGTTFDGGSFAGAEFSGGSVSFAGAEFSGGGVRFDYSLFSGGVVSFSGARFSDGLTSFVSARFSASSVSFDEAEFSGGTVSFERAEFSGGVVTFGCTRFSGGVVSFSDARFSGGAVFINGARFSGSRVSFSDARFTAGQVSFSGARFSGGVVSFSGARFSGSTVSFGDTDSAGSARFSGGSVGFEHAEFSGGSVGFEHAEFSGGCVGFERAEFSGGEVDFGSVRSWQIPPKFPASTSPPPGVTFPAGRPDSR